MLIKQLLLMRNPGLAMTACAAVASYAFAADEPRLDPSGEILPTNQRITPIATPDAVLNELRPGLPEAPSYTAGGAMSTAISPDGKTLLVLTSGYNRLNDQNGKQLPGASNEYVFVFDVEHGKPVQKQVLQVANTFAGIVFAPDGQSFYVSGGKDDNVHVFAISTNGSWTESGCPIKLGHKAGNGPNVPPLAAGLAITGSTLVVANINSDSVSLVDVSKRAVRLDVDLRPGKVDPSKIGVPGGEYPFWVTIKGGKTAYVSSWRDREIVLVDIEQRRVVGRIKLKGNPNRMVFNHRQSLLYAASDNSDLVDVIDTDFNRVVASVRTTAPEWLMTNLKRYRGSAPNSLAISPDDKALYVTNGETNSIAVVQLTGPAPKVIGLVPTGFYPNSVSLSRDGKQIYVCNGRSPTGPDPTSSNRTTNDYILQLHHSSLLSFPVPQRQILTRLTNQVALNNSFFRGSGRRDESVMSQLRHRIRHIIYVIKENRSYDQILGDLDRGNGDPTLVEFGQAVTPNLHKMARAFVDLDNFYDAADVSADGWPWSTSGRQTDWVSKTVPMTYAGRGSTYDYEGENRNVDLALPTLDKRRVQDPSLKDPDLLPGSANVAAPDGPAGTPEGTGYLWDAVLRAGLTVRNYGCFGISATTKLQPYPFKANAKLFIPTSPALLKHTDCYYLGFDTRYPDFYREKEWEREFDEFVRSQRLPSFEIVRLPQDHTDTKVVGIDGVTGPEVQVADNDYAVGCLIQKVAHSPYKSDTLIFVLEDDAQSGEDHVDAHRSTTYIVGPYVKRGAVVSVRYTTINLIRTIEDVLGLDHLNINTATQRPMSACFDLHKPEWTFRAKPSSCLAATRLPIPHSTHQVYHFTHDAEYWAAKTAEFDFSVADNLSDPEKYNRIIWEGLKGNIPYPTKRDGRDLRKNRIALLRNAGLGHNQPKTNR
jgi:DNA-binding beta-propeller fold protein YncE